MVGDQELCPSDLYHLQAFVATHSTAGTPIGEFERFYRVENFRQITLHMSYVLSRVLEIHGVSRALPLQEAWTQQWRGYKDHGIVALYARKFCSWRP